MATAQSYRRLLGAIRTKFAGDQTMLLGARAEVRTHFYNNAAATGVAQLAEMRGMADEAAMFLTQNLQQAKLQDSGTYKVTVGKEQTFKADGGAPEHLR